VLLDQERGGGVEDARGAVLQVGLGDWGLWIEAVRQRLVRGSARYRPVVRARQAGAGEGHKEDDGAARQHGGVSQAIGAWRAGSLRTRRLERSAFTTCAPPSLCGPAPWRTRA